MSLHRIIEFVVKDAHHNHSATTPLPGSSQTQIERMVSYEPRDWSPVSENSIPRTSKPKRSFASQLKDCDELLYSPHTRKMRRVSDESMIVMVPKMNIDTDDELIKHKFGVDTFGSFHRVVKFGEPIPLPNLGSESARETPIPMCWDQFEQGFEKEMQARFEGEVEMWALV